MTATPRYRLGRDLTPLDLTSEAACFEGRPRLRPGHVIEVVNVPSARGPEARKAVVESWVVTTLGNKGPMYRGMCRWLQPSG